MATDNTRRSTPELIDAPREHWQGHAGGLYALAIVDLTQLAAGGTAAREGAFLADLAVTEFAFTPQQVERESMPAVVVTGTPGGIITEHQGNQFHLYRVSGTTGQRPNRGIGGSPISSVLGVALPKFIASALNPIDEDTGLPEGERTGFDGIVDILNLEAKYYAAMLDPELAHKYALVWQDGWLGEFYKCELVPPGIVVRRRRLHSTYDFTIQTTKRLDVLVAELADDNTSEQAGGLLGFLQRMGEFAAALQQTFAFVTGLIDRVAGIARAVINAFIAPWAILMDAIRGLIASGGRIFSIPRDTLLSVITAGRALARDLDDIATGEAAAYRQRGIIMQSTELSHAIKEAARTMLRINREVYAFVQPQSAAVAALARRAARTAANARDTRGSRLNPLNMRAYRGARQADIEDGDTLRSISARLLGDVARWKELQLLNGLVPPYISPAGDGRQVLRPRLDKILFPVETDTGDDSLVSASSSASGGLSVLERRLGVDIRLVQTAEGKWDYARSPSGDIDTIRGLDNMEQALMLQFETPMGGLLLHPLYGDFRILGRKAPKRRGGSSGGAPVRSLAQAQMMTRAMLLRDSRVQAVNRLKVRLEGNALAREGSVTLIGGDKPTAFAYTPAGG